MSTQTADSRPTVRRLGAYLGLVVGLGVTAASMSSGFIWASQGKVLLVYVAGFFSWTGYVFAHYAVVGEFVDDVSEDDNEVGSGAGSGDCSEDGSGDAASEKHTEADVGRDGDGGNGDGVEGGDGDGDGGGSLGERLSDLRAILRNEPLRVAGFLAGIAVLVAGIAILAWYVRQENHLLGNLGSGMFLGGYVVAHYFDARKLL